MKIKKRKLIAKNSVHKIYFDELEIKDNLIKNYLVLDCLVKNKHNCGGVLIIPQINDRFLILKYFNHIHNKWIYTFPGGFVDKNESTRKAAKRELYEETGILVNQKNLISLGIITPIPPLINSKIHFFSVKVNFFTKTKTDSKEHDKIKSILLKKTELIKIFKENTNVDSLAVSCLFRYILKYEKI